jgi:hypothetical protein
MQLRPWGVFLAIAFLGAVALSIVDHAVARNLQNPALTEAVKQSIQAAVGNRSWSRCWLIFRRRQSERRADPQGSARGECQVGYVDCYGNCIKRSCGRRPDPSSDEGWPRRRPQSV